MWMRPPSDDSADDDDLPPMDDPHWYLTEFAAELQQLVLTGEQPGEIRCRAEKGRETGLSFLGGIWPATWSSWTSSQGGWT